MWGKEKNVIMEFAGKFKELENIAQTQKGKCCWFPALNLNV